MKITWKSSSIVITSKVSIISKNPLQVITLSKLPKAQLLPSIRLLIIIIRTKILFRHKIIIKTRSIRIAANFPTWTTINSNNPLKVSFNKTKMKSQLKITNLIILKHIKMMKFKQIMIMISKLIVKEWKLSL